MGNVLIDRKISYILRIVDKVYCYLYRAKQILDKQIKFREAVDEFGSWDFDKIKKILKPMISRTSGNINHMRMKGLEPPRVLARQILSLLRLPFRHIRLVTRFILSQLFLDFKYENKKLEENNFDHIRSCMI